MAGKDADAVALEGVPDVAVEVVVAGEKVSPALRERHRGDPAQDVVGGVLHQLPVRPDVKQTARRVVRPCPERHPVGEILNGVDV